MKKLLILFILIFCSIISFAQSDPAPSGGNFGSLSGYGRVASGDTIKSIYITGYGWLDLAGLRHTVPYSNWSQNVNGTGHTESLSYLVIGGTTSANINLQSISGTPGVPLNGINLYDKGGFSFIGSDSLIRTFADHNTGNRQYFWPDVSDTVAMRSWVRALLSGYVTTTGGALTGPLNMGSYPLNFNAGAISTGSASWIFHASLRDGIFFTDDMGNNIMTLDGNVSGADQPGVALFQPLELTNTPVVPQPAFHFLVRDDATSAHGTVAQISRDSTIALLKIDSIAIAKADSIQALTTLQTVTGNGSITTKPVIATDHVAAGDSTRAPVFIADGSSISLALGRGLVETYAQAFPNIVGGNFGMEVYNMSVSGRYFQKNSTGDGSIVDQEALVPNYTPGSILLAESVNDPVQDSTLRNASTFQSQGIAFVNYLVTTKGWPASHIIISPTLGYTNYTGNANHGYIPYRINQYTAAANAIASATGCLAYVGYTAGKPTASTDMVSDSLHFNVSGNARNAANLTAFLTGYFSVNTINPKSNVYGNQTVLGNQKVYGTGTFGTINAINGNTFGPSTFNGPIMATYRPGVADNYNIILGSTSSSSAVTSGTTKSGDIEAYDYTNNLYGLMDYVSQSTTNTLTIGQGNGTYSPTSLRFYVGSAVQTNGADMFHLFASGGKAMGLSSVSGSLTDPGAGNFSIQDNAYPTSDNFYTLGASGKRWSTVYGVNYQMGGTGVPFSPGSTSNITFASFNGIAKFNGSSAPTQAVSNTDFLPPTSPVMSAPTINGKITVSTSANNAAAFATLAAGTVTVSNTSVTANSIILIQHKTSGGTVGTYSYSVTPGTSFTITSSSSTDTSVVGYVIIN
jgi:hypothetical protein